VNSFTFLGKKSTTKIPFRRRWHFFIFISLNFIYLK